MMQNIFFYFYLSNLAHTTSSLFNLLVSLSFPLLFSLDLQNAMKG